MVISFNTNGLQQQDATTWTDPRTGDVAKVQVAQGTPFPGEWLRDPYALQRGFAGMYAEQGCLIEVELVNLGGVTAVRQLIKLPLPNAPAGQLFMAMFTLAKAPQYAQLMYLAKEQGMTGMREATLMPQFGFENWTLPHPFDPQLQSRLPFHRGDDPAFDAQFPDHPLSRARAFTWNVGRYATVDPAFAAIPDNWNA
ncbi:MULTISPECIES: hypothetical protein [Glycomyces]|uniref:Uncharacterized protein n=2 Tax=Glycomyces TaxID=58113 RepID=A0A9X3PMA6_9ACTN|nr:hypothetical protein [Glycomyces lechevalierae]MDA1386569.1 hypothetical protein [Glycomyces lechevalierae]MDR7340635.1 hypothetical protein [Glycomyces lechevalierae]